ncbi:S-adenosyl-L-methionine-dependent methyltransferase [Apiospora arundinis]
MTMKLDGNVLLGEAPRKPPRMILTQVPRLRTFAIRCRFRPNALTLAHLTNSPGSASAAAAAAAASYATLTSGKPAARKNILLKSELTAVTPTAQKLVDTGLWKHRTGKAPGEGPEGEDGDDQPKKPKKPRAKKGPKGDKNRVNIVSEELCDDIISYIGSSLKRHKGCDILDLYPGAGLWSRKLNDYLKPRSHILMEPDAEFYTPFLQDLIDRPGTRLVPQSGILWKELSSVLNPEFLPHQQLAPQSHRNDTLLVTGNIALHPKKRFMGFSSIARLVQHQFVDAIRAGQIFHRYGQVRLLLWTRRDDEGSLLSRSMQRRKRSAIEAELYCEHIHEVCGKPGSDSVWYVRDANLDRYSAQLTAQRMKASKMTMPKRRTPQHHKDALVELKKKSTRIVPGTLPPTFVRPYHETLANLQENNETNEYEKDSEERMLMRKLNWRENSDIARFDSIFQRQQAYDAIVALRKDGKTSEEEIRKLEMEWDDEFSRLPDSKRGDYLACSDNLHLVRQDPPVLAWDQRQYEPLETSELDFFPNVDTGPGSNRAADIFELLTRALLMSSASSLHKLLDGIWPGAADWIIPRCKSLHDPALGGKALKCQYSSMSPRILNQQQWEELLELWMEWPFRPSYQELLARSQDDSIADDHESDEV